jgi:nucleotide-binding universal stress UspA family protein
MNKIKTNKILVPIDFSDTALKAIMHAGFIAKLTKGELIFLHVQKKKELVDIIFPALNKGNIKMVTEFLMKKLEKLATQVRRTYEIKVTSLVVSGNVTSEIVKASEKNKVGLIIMGTRGKDSTNDLFMGSNSYRALTKSSIPIMTVHSKMQKSWYDKILIPIDTSYHTRQKVDSAIYLAEKFGSQLHVIGLIGNGEVDYKYKMEVILGQIKKLAREKGVTCITKIQASVNRAKTTLTYSDKIQASLVIVMTDQHAEFSSIVLGTYAHQLINESKVPVICIPPEEHSENFPMDSLGGMW